MGMLSRRLALRLQGARGLAAGLKAEPWHLMHLLHQLCTSAAQAHAVASLQAMPQGSAARAGSMVMRLAAHKRCHHTAQRSQECVLQPGDYALIPPAPALHVRAAIPAGLACHAPTPPRSTRVWLPQQLVFKHTRRSCQHR